jgi:hypothetical protein
MSMLDRLFRRFAPAGAAAPVDWGLTPRPQLLEVDKWRLSGLLSEIVSIVGVSPYPLDELMLMGAAMVYHRPQAVIDIGTHFGKSARIWHEYARRLSLVCEIHTIDLCDPEHPEFPGGTLGEYFKGLPVTQHIGDGCEVAMTLLDQRSDAAVLLYVDGDHRYETVRRELELAGRMHSGCIIVHDTFYQPGSTYNHGPYLAIQDAVPSLPVEQVIHLQTGLPGMSYLGPKPRDGRA